MCVKCKEALQRVPFRLLDHFDMSGLTTLDLSGFKSSSASNEFRSDTFTTPTISMVSAIAKATSGDAVYNEDKSTQNLETTVSKLAGKEAGLFCVSGTLLNQIALRTNLFQPPHAVLCDYRGHVYAHEAGGLPTLSQAMVQPIKPRNGIHLTLEDDIIPNFVPDDGEIHSAPTKVISLENTLHGMIFPIEEIEKISNFCRKHDIRLHLDGARLWNASAATGISIAKYCSYFDSVSLCLSKTLGAPIGSVLVGNEKFIRKANHFRKQNGGGIRQSGLLAEMALVAIEENFPKLAATHEIAKELGRFCEDQGAVLKHPVHTNFVFIDLVASKIDPDFLESSFKKNNVKGYGSRITIHYQISEEALFRLKLALQSAFDEAKRNPFNGKQQLVFYDAK